MIYIEQPLANHPEEPEESQDTELANLQNENSESNSTDSTESIGNKSPIIPSEVFLKLPDILKKGTHIFTVERDRDIFLTSALAVLSGCFPNVYGLYYGDKAYSNLYSFIIAPPGSGKGKMRYARGICELIHKDMKGLLKSEKEIKLVVKPRLLFIPGDNSAASIIEQLSVNEGIGIICEPEADTLSIALNQKWGNFSDLLRKSFQNELISFQRKKDSQFIEIPTPKLACALTGTPDQVGNLIHSVNNGLFSRFLYYYFDEPAKIKALDNVESRIDFSEHFAGIAKEVHDLYLKVSERESIRFELTNEQNTELFNKFQEFQDLTLSFEGDATNGIVIRLQLIAYKICMLLTILNLDLTTPIPDVIECNSGNFQIALLLIETYLQHSMIVYQKQSKQKKITSLTNVLQSFYDKLPTDFDRKQAIDVADSLNVKERTADNYLKGFLHKGYLIKNAHGKYVKSDR